VDIDAPLQTEPVKPELGRAAAGTASAWSAVDLLGRQGVTLVVSIIMARLLTPADFGAVALAAFFSTIVIAVVQNGLGTAVIQRHGASDAEVSSIFWWNLIASALLAVALAVAGPRVASYYELPVLSPLMLAAAAQVVFTSLGAVHQALLTRELRFGAIAKAGIPATALSGGIGVLLALSGRGLWAIAAQLVSAAALNSLALWVVNRWRPAPVLRAAGLKDALHFGGWVSLSAGLEVLYTQGFALVLGKLYGPRDLGLYMRAFNTQQLPGTVISGIIARVALPLFARRRDDEEAMRRGLLAANRMAMVISLPALVGLALTSDLVIRVLFGPQWDGAAPVLAILAWAGALYPLSANNLQLLLASGRSDVYFRLEIAKKLIGVLAVIVGSWFGIIGLAWGQLMFTVMALLINSWPTRRYYRCGIEKQVADLGGVIAATVAMGAGVVAVRQLVHAGAITELLACIVLGGGLYAAAGMLLRIHAFSEVIAMSRSLWKSQAAV
jgi:teichuronic acid exporter